jgi:hypothetical protein
MQEPSTDPLINCQQFRRDPIVSDSHVGVTIPLLDPALRE